MADTNRPQISTSEDMLSRLPYELTAGVTATMEGLVVSPAATAYAIFIYYKAGDFPVYERVNGDLLVLWCFLFDLLLYRKGEPWCDGGAGGVIVSYPANWYEHDEYKYRWGLHRLATVFCDEANDLNVFRWCIHNLGGSK